ncbi:outer membrane protein assembly factor BamB family protein [Paenibacillus sp. SAF-054]|uniref:outer membrane protein assembly factor BamB family protein n=1 Tax=unclassified Paenibacillus TaxID=185978 RepID=UPI003F819034
MRTLKPAKAAAALLAVGMLIAWPGAAGMAQSSSAAVSASASSVSARILQYRAPYFVNDPGKDTGWKDLKAAGYGSKGQTVKVKPGSELGEMTAVLDGGQVYWLPVWYATAAAKSIQETRPAYVTLSPDIKLSLAPGSNMKWTLPRTETKLVALARWQGWTGIMISPVPWHTETEIYRPILLWVRDASITSRTTIPSGFLSQGSFIPVDTARNITELLLQKGDDATRVKNLLGEPDVTEHSSNLAELGQGKPMHIGTSWRYERADASFTVSFSQQGKLESWKWILPADPVLRIGAYAERDPSFSYDFLSIPIATTVGTKPIWRNQGNLDYAYLIGATEDALLMNGDDGRFSGMHDDSSIYAIDRATGRKLWQVPAGFGSYGASLDSARNTAAVYTEYNPSSKKYEPLVRELSLKDGRVQWEKRLPEGQSFQMYAAKDAILLYQPASGDSSGVLTVLDRGTGARRWTKVLGAGQQVLGTYTEDAYVLLQEGRKLQALNPANGTVTWSITGLGENHQDVQQHPYYAYGSIRQPLQPEQADRRWFLLGDHWLLLSTDDGKVWADKAWNKQERFETSNEERYILVQQSGGSSDFDSSKVERTVLYDIFEKRALFTLPGKAVNGALDPQRLYVVLNGLPAAFDRETGTLLWQMPISTRESASPYTLDEMAKTRYAVLSKYVLLGYGSDMLALRKEDGEVIGRLRDNRIAFSEARYRKGVEGLLNMNEDEIYVGSSNGGLARYGASELEALLNQVK